MYDISERLDTYLKRFKYDDDDSTAIMDGVLLPTCPSLNNTNEDSKHDFIQYCVGENLCHKCNKICCLHCTYDIKSTPFICIQCKNLSLSTSPLPTEAVMRNKLA